MCIATPKSRQRLKQELPHWYLEDGWIRRKYKTNSWKGTLMVINTVGHLSEAAWHHPDITASYAWVEVRLKNHAAKGITDKDFALAKKIEDVVHWQPAKEESALGRHAGRRHAFRLYQIRQAQGLTAVIPRLRGSSHLFNGARLWRRSVRFGVPTLSLASNPICPWLN